MTPVPLSAAALTAFHDSMSLKDARDELRNRVEHGHECPCCKQYAKVYKRTIYATIARALIVMYREGGTSECVHIPSLFARKAAADVPKLRHWGLIEEERAVREDGGRAGYWRVTGKGEQFVLNHVTVPRNARVYDNRVLSFTGRHVSIVDCLGTAFDYRELMSS
jgi:hypothetical protein